MLYHILFSYKGTISFLNLFKYVTFRTGGALLTALLISFVVGPSFIKWLKKKQKNGQPIREDGPESHLITKKGTPTMGGVLILGSLCFSTILWARLDNIYIWIMIIITLGFGALGAMDDYLKLTRSNTRGVSGKKKLIAQVSIALVSVMAITIYSPHSLSNVLTIPFLKDTVLNLGWFYVPFAIFVIVGSSNAVNLTDGLDGLAIVPVIIASACFFAISYLVGHSVFANYLQIHHVPNVSELGIFCGAMIGAGLGFLWFNAPPAKVFMGDTGSLAAGGALGTLSVITKHELVLAIIGGLFVIEAISVILQVGYYKLTKKRIFLMAPIHHHFEKKGWSEPTVVIRFWIIATVLAIIGLSTLKLR